MADVRLLLQQRKHWVARGIQIGGCYSRFSIKLCIAGMYGSRMNWTVSVNKTFWCCRKDLKRYFCFVQKAFPWIEKRHVGCHSFSFQENCSVPRYLWANKGVKEFSHCKTKNGCSAVHMCVKRKRLGLTRLFQLNLLAISQTYFLKRLHDSDSVSVGVCSLEESGFCQLTCFAMTPILVTNSESYLSNYLHDRWS